ncbi:hypothetical protein PBAC_07290 [Pedobacter glucosidilyticus]|nr:hypothetical protein [Pedobacter glucosidilyticus]KHJ39129.1 hypothetical protein PBAC_07290 [Pedobacter glucosidilyticus]
MIIPEEYHILPFQVPFKVKEFEKTYQEGDFVLSLERKDINQWFDEFIKVIENAIVERKFLPICRMSDGEFIFCVGEQLPSKRLGTLYRLRYFIRRKLAKIIKGTDFKAATLPNVPSGSYSQKEISLIKEKYANYIKKISEMGILALDFTVFNEPFQEQYFKPFYNWLNKNKIYLNTKNYYPFYFVYMALLGEQKVTILNKRNILVVHSAKDKKREKINSELTKYEVLNVEWLSISSDRSLYDQINVSQLKSKPDLILIGAGVGKPNIILQLEQLSVPCLDAGYVFEVWYDDANKWKRRYCVTDSEYNPELINL